ncbi:MAG: hypothetical protein K2N34_12595 [Lachnospiraceae bacterium]|nr:hypothetical protein [Lachnospiraceae bacterium]
MLKTNLDFLVKNEDFKSENEFYEMLNTNKKEIIDDLKWRISGGKMKGEVIKNHNEYIEQCKKLLEELE